MTYYPALILSFLAAFQLFFVAVFLIFHKRGNHRNNRLLGFVFLLFGFSIANITAQVVDLEFISELVYLIDDGFFYLYGPLLYFYVQSVVYSDFRFKPIDLLHILPYSIHLAYLFNVVFILDINEQHLLFEKTRAYDYPLISYLFLGAIFIYLFAYLWFSYRTILTYQSIIKNKFSTLKGVSLDWLRFIINSFVFVTLFAMIHNVLPALGSTSLNIASLIVLVGFIFFFINRVVIKALNQPEVFSGIALKESGKYSDANVSREEINDHRSRLMLALENEKLYLNPDLTIKLLADHVSTNTKVLSQVINQSFNKKFYDLINSYRCNEVKNVLMNSDDRMTILEAMYQSGFNSKSSFNKEFKKLTGQTPTEFKRSIGK
ncbi:MAG: helix-turn-helix transcriptional regulator [Cytophagales bacterium]|nr:helix-turn-helix transcriptional regulator [Cytophagales bacterium]